MVDWLTTYKIQIFQALSRADLTTLCAQARTQRLAPRAVVFRQGDISQKLYIILEGSVGVYVKDSENEYDDEGESSAELGKFVVELKVPAPFGELGLLQSAARSATVAALQPTTLLTIDKVDFDRVLARKFNLQKTSKAMASIPFFQNVPKKHLPKLALFASIMSVGPPRVILRRGEPNSVLYFIVKGECLLERPAESGNLVAPPLKVALLGPGELFGDDAAFENTPMQYTVSAASAATLLSIKRDDLIKRVNRLVKLSMRTSMQARKMWRERTYQALLQSEHATLVGQFSALPVTHAATASTSSSSRGSGAERSGGGAALNSPRLASPRGPPSSPHAPLIYGAQLPSQSAARGEINAAQSLEQAPDARRKSVALSAFLAAGLPASEHHPNAAAQSRGTGDLAPLRLNMTESMRAHLAHLLQRETLTDADLVKLRNHALSERRSSLPLISCVTPAAAQPAPEVAQGSASFFSHQPPAMPALMPKLALLQSAEAHSSNFEGAMSLIMERSLHHLAPVGSFPTPRRAPGPRQVASLAFLMTPR
jgi:CRP-like cAMP-binding protein